MKTSQILFIKEQYTGAENCKKFKSKLNLDNRIIPSEDWHWYQWARIRCSLQQGQFVNRSVEFPLRLTDHGQNLSGNLFSSGWYRIQLKVVDEYDEEFMCLEVKSMLKYPNSANL